MPPLALVSLPPEILAAILAVTDLRTVVAASHSCTLLRRVCQQFASVWAHVLAAAFADANLVMSSSRPALQRPHIDLPLLRNLGSFTSLPSRAFVLLLPCLSRSFLAFEAELPRLSNEEWRLVVQRRFPYQLRTSGAPRWRERFLRGLNYLANLDDASITGARRENMVSQAQPPLGSFGQRMSYLIYGSA